jgi:hypothetical protein
MFEKGKAIRLPVFTGTLVAFFVFMALGGHFRDWCC